jgi:hypothetical protein
VLLFYTVDRRLEARGDFVNKFSGRILLVAVEIIDELIQKGRNNRDKKVWYIY